MTRHQGQDRTDEWVYVGRLEELEEGGVTAVTVGSRRLVVARVDSQVHVFGERCPHRGGPLCRGIVRPAVESDAPGQMRVNHDVATLTCPWHGWEFRLDSGHAVADPAVRARRYASKVVDDQVLVWLRGTR